MRIRNKLLVLTVVFVSLYTIGLLSVITVLVHTKFLAIEADLARADINRVIHALKVEAYSLEVTVRDYAVWDETWKYAKGTNPDYIEEGLGPTAFDNLNLAAIAIYGASGNLVFSRNHDPDHGDSTCAYFPERLAPGDFRKIREHSSEIKQYDGLPLIVESEPILHTDGSGPSAGFLLMARRIGDQFLSDIQSGTGVFVERVSGKLPDDLENKRSESNIETGMRRARKDPLITGYIQIRAEDGSPSLLLRTQTVRALKTQSANVALSMLILFGTLTFFFVFSVSIAFRYWVVIPLSLLENVVDSIILESGSHLPRAAQPPPGHDPERKIATLFSRRDEIGHIAAVIQQMNKRVHDAHESVRKTNENLESLVAERTADLVSINTKLDMFRKILENTSEAVIITDLEGNIIDMNESMCAMTGYTREELLGRNSRLFKSGRHDEEFYTRMWNTVSQTGHWEGELWDRKKDGMLYPKWQTINVIHDENGEPVNYIGVSTDISVIKEAEERLNHLAYYDPLTGLPNRMLFSDRLEHQIACSRRASSCFGLLFIDLDRFKNVNDTLGHMAGDSLLVMVSARLKECIRGSDTLCRIGGDEFTVILQDLAQEENAGMIASSIVTRLSERFVVEGSDVYIGASIGIGLYPKDGTDSETLLRKVDAAMYVAKESGRGIYCYASGEMERANRGRLEIEAKMHQALERKEFRLYYQPQNEIEDAVPGSSAGLFGVEALIRWNPEDDLLIPPCDFLPVAEETGFISPLGDWVLFQACSDAKRWFDMGRRVPVSVNVAVRQFDTGNFVDRVASVLAETGLPPELLKLEVTESGFMRNITHVTEIMRKLQALGVSFAIDDFGTGYCSLQYLNKLPVDCLKIDQSFVRTMDDIHTGGDIVSAIVSMARAFGLTSIAEGVETFDQLERLRARGCDLVQGYLVSRPLPFDEFMKYLER